MTPEKLRELEVWLAQHTAGRALLDANTIAVVQAAYAGIDFYDKGEVEEAADAAADTSNAAQLIATGLMAQYLAEVLSTMTGEEYVTPSILLPPLRFGVDLRRVYQRPIKLFRRQVAKGVEPAEAYRQAMTMAEILTETNNSLASRETAKVVLDKLGDQAGVTGYRRVLRPELSRTGSCGLCIVASDRVYKRRDLMPLHARCNCDILPIIGAAGGAGDPGNSFNNLDLADIYELAGGSDHAFDLKKLRVQVYDHGELGPSLAAHNQKTTEWGDIGLPARNAA